MLPVLLAVAVLAQAPPPRAPYPGPSADLSPRETIGSPPIPGDETHRLLRAPLELLGGAALGVAAGFTATLLVCALTTHSSDGEEIPACVGTFFLVAPLVMPAATWAIGNALDGDGSLLATYGGLVGAGLVSGALALTMGNHFDDTPVPATVSVLLFALGPTLGYELSSHARASRFAIVPAVSPHGTGLSLVGTF